MECFGTRLTGRVNVLPSPARHRDEPRWQLPGGCKRQLRVRFGSAAGTAQRCGLLQCICRQELEAAEGRQRAQL